jgi:1,4-dihydroxy-6-naphthoate synthase
VSAERVLRFGFSPCPNDTFAFHALVHGKFATPGFQIEPVLADVEELNRKALKAELEVSKLSFHALAHVLDDYVLLRSGAALGRGCGPLLIAKPGSQNLDLSQARIAVPGQYTTAHLLLTLYAGAPPEVEPMLFSGVMPAVARGEYDAGLIIHEGRFTYQRLGLESMVDLGEWWEAETGLPIPLGCIAARRDLGRDMVLALEKVLARSVEMAWTEPEASRDYVLAHSQEMELPVVDQHIGLYVNSFTKDLGDEGMRAVEFMLEKGRAAGLLPASSQPLTL